MDYNDSKKNMLSIFSYLSDVEYHVSAHFEWNMNRPELELDRNENKHFFQAKRALEKGGRRDIFLGTRDCQGYVEPCDFNHGTGAYDRSKEFTFDIMFHGFDYADETGKGELSARFWSPVMEAGIIEFLRPEQCAIRKSIRNYQMKSIGVSEDDPE